MFDKAKTRIRVIRDNRILAQAAPPRDSKGRFTVVEPPLTQPGRRFKLGRERITLSTTSPEERAALEAVRVAARIHMRNKLNMANALVRTKHPLFDGVQKPATLAAKRRSAHQARKAQVAARAAFANRAV